MGGDGADGSATTVAGVPVQLAAGSGSSLETALIVMAVALVLGVALVPPLIARALGSRRRR